MSGNVIWLYHITHINNLPNILVQGGLLANNVLQSQYTNIAHEGIQARRHTTQVSCGPGGVLHDYVPLYFCKRSPMLYAIKNNLVARYSGGQSDIVYLVVRFENVEKSDLSWVFTDGHATMALSDFYSTTEELINIDWELMKAPYWHDTDEEPDRKRRRQAEFLVHERLPWSVVSGVGVYDEAHKQQVESIFNELAVQHRPNVKALPKWYY